MYARVHTFVSAKTLRSGPGEDVTAVGWGRQIARHYLGPTPRQRARQQVYMAELRREEREKLRAKQQRQALRRQRVRAHRLAQGKSAESHLGAGLIAVAVVGLALWWGVSYITTPHAWKMPNVVGLTLDKADTRLGNINGNLAWATGATGATGVAGATGVTGAPDVWENDNWTVCSQSPGPGVMTASATLYLAHTGYGEKCLANGGATDPSP